MFFFGEEVASAEIYRDMVTKDKSVPKIDWGPVDEMDLQTLRKAYCVTRMICSEADAMMAPEEVQRVTWVDHDLMFEELMKYCPIFRERYAKGLFRFPMSPSPEREAVYNEIFKRISTDPQYDIDDEESYTLPSAF